MSAKKRRVALAALTACVAALAVTGTATCGEALPRRPIRPQSDQRDARHLRQPRGQAAWHRGLVRRRHPHDAGWHDPEAVVAGIDSGLPVSGSRTAVSRLDDPVPHERRARDRAPALAAGQQEGKAGPVHLSRVPAAAARALARRLLHARGDVRAGGGSAVCPSRGRLPGCAERLHVQQKVFCQRTGGAETAQCRIRDRSFAFIGLVLLGVAAWGVAASVRHRRLAGPRGESLPPLPARFSKRQQA